MVVMDKWTRSIAVGSKEFSGEVQSRLGGLALGRKVRKIDDDYHNLENLRIPIPTTFSLKNTI